VVFGESDFLPGLVVDRYDDVLVVQITTAGMERLRTEILEALQRVVSPAGILLLNDNPVRALEGLDMATEVIGVVPESITLEEGGARFEIPLGSGQKTGWFFDQRDNRQAMHKYVKGKSVLDVFSYVGAWGVQAAPALAAIKKNCLANKVDDRVSIEGGDAFDVMAAMKEAGRKFDVVIVDPPAFIKRRKDIKKGEQGYARLNRLAMQFAGWHIDLLLLFHAPVRESAAEYPAAIGTQAGAHRADHRTWFPGNRSPGASGHS